MEAFFNQLSPIEIQIITQRSFERYFKAAEKILNYFKCEKCGKCCREIPVTIDRFEVAILSKHMGLRPTVFINRFCFLKNGKVNIKPPCPFLTKNNLCGVYKMRPKVCRFYPFSLLVPALWMSCPLGSKIWKYIESNFNLEEFKGFLKNSPKDPLDESIQKLFDLLVKKQDVNFESFWKRNVHEIFNPKGESGEMVPLVAFSVPLLEYVASKLNEKHEGECKGKNEEKTIDEAL